MSDNTVIVTVSVVIFLACLLTIDGGSIPEQDLLDVIINKLNK